MAIGIAMLASALALTALMRAAPRLGWLDRPDLRKPHTQPVPPIGGVAWLLGLGTALLTLPAGPELLPWLLLLGAMLCTGLIDDLRPLPSTLRLALQAGVAVLATLWLAKLHSLGVLLPGLPAFDLGWAAAGVTVFALVGVINASNMADGMDGLAGSYLLICLLTLAGLHGWQGDGQLAALAVAALLPFLVCNLRLPWQPRARVFFGDAGSMSAGLLVGLLLVRATQGPAAVFAPATALWLFAVPLIDTVSVMLRRMAAGRSPLAPDQQHVHHLLLRAGLPVAAAWAVLVMVALACAGFGAWCAVVQAPAYAQFLGFMGLALGYHFWVCRGLRIGRMLGRPLRAALSRV